MTAVASLLDDGWAQHQAGALGAAEQCYRQAVQDNPGDARAWCFLGMVCHDQKRYDEAVRAYRKALEIQPAYPIALHNVGNSLLELGRLDECIEAADQAIRLRPEYAKAHTL